MAKTSKAKKVTCDLCCDTIEKTQDSLTCEGECGSFVHRYCVGVTKRQYEEFRKGSTPFVCQYCSLKTLNGIIEQQKSEIAVLKTQLCGDLVQQQQSEIASLKSELTEIKCLLAARQSVPAPATSYAAMTAGASRRQHPLSTRSERAASGRQQPSRIRTATTTRASVPNASEDSESRSSNSLREKERILGTTRLWGTLPTTQTAAVISTLRKLTKAGSKLRVYRNTKTSRQGKACRWFSLKGDENDLCVLENEWDPVALQTKWKLEYCYKLNVMPNTPTSAVVHESNNSSATNVPSANDQKPTDDKDAEEASTAILTLADPSQLSSSSMRGNSIQDDNGELTVSDNFLLVEGVNQTHSN